MKMKRKLEDFGELSAAEQKIVDELDSGEDIDIHKGLPPETGGDYDVRAAFIRYLALGGCEACCLHEKGLRIVGAHITGMLDLEGGAVPHNLCLAACRFEGDVVFRSAKVQNLILSKSILPQGLNADGLEAKGSVLLQGVETFGEVRLLGAVLGGDLDCDGASFQAGRVEDSVPLDCAFFADGLEAKGGAFFKKVVAHGEVRLIGAKLGGDLDCSDAKFNAARVDDGRAAYIAFRANGLAAAGNVFLRKVEADGEVSLMGAKLGGDLACDGAKFNAPTKGDKTECDKYDAFCAEQLEARGAFFLRDGAEIHGRNFNCRRAGGDIR